LERLNQTDDKIVKLSKEKMGNDTLKHFEIKRSEIVNEINHDLLDMQNLQNRYGGPTDVFQKFHADRKNIPDFDFSNVAK